MYNLLATKYNLFIIFQGWTYAVDFCTKFYPIKRWNSCVRRRKWFRNRIYTGTNSWCIISPLHKDFTQVL